MSTVSRRGLLTMFRGGDPRGGTTTGIRPKQPGFSLDTFYANRTERGEVTGLRVPAVVRRDDGIATETSSVGVTREREGVVRIREKDCLGYTSFCSVCSERCPVPGAIVIELGRPRVDPAVCDGCGICVGVCPAPVNALDKVAR